MDATITITGRYQPELSAEGEPAEDLDDTATAPKTDPSVFYRPLNSKDVQTRVLILYPGNASDTLHCAVETVSLNDTSRDDYEALSYCWGDTTEHNIIQLKSFFSADEADDEFRPFRIHDSLYQALLHLRPSTGNPRKLWADAICINQADLVERAQQVTNMPLIYQRATRVVIWLGPMLDRRRHCVNDMLDIQRRIAQRRQDSQDYTEDEWIKVVRECSRPIGDNLEVSTMYYERWAECNFDWFTRTWVLQEIANSRDRTVFCGKEELSWDTLCSVERCTQKQKEDWGWSTLPVKSIMPSTFLNLVSDTQTPHRGTVEPPVRQGILETLIAAHVMKATDVRDKLFAMLQFGDDTSAHVGMDLDLQDSRIRPDYYKDPTTVFCDFVRWWIDKHKTLRILSAIHSLRDRSWQQTYYGESKCVSTLSYPTWSFNLTHGGESDWAKATLGLNIGTKYQASGSTEPNILPNDTQNDHILKIAGHRICTIQEIAPFPFWRPFEPFRVWEDLRRVFSRIFDPIAMRRSTKHRKYYDQGYVENTLAEEVEELEARHYTSHYRGSNQTRQVSLPCMSPCLFSTKETLPEPSTGRGLCPHNARPGDIVVMLFGGAVLYLLRPKGSGPDLASGDTQEANTHPEQFYFVGECYLDGYMYGRALEEANDAFALGLEPEIFNLA